MNKKNYLTMIMACIIILLIGVCIYLAFFKKEDLKEKANCVEEKVCEKCEDCSKKSIVNSDEPVLTYQDGLLEINLDENEKQFIFNGKTLKMKIVDSDDEHSGLYLNGKLVDNKYGNYILYVTEKFILVSWPGTTCGGLIIGYIDENGNYYNEVLAELYTNDSENDITFAIYKENGKIIGNAPVTGKIELCESDKKIEFVYDKGKLIVKDVK